MLAPGLINLERFGINCHDLDGLGLGANLRRDMVVGMRERLVIPDYFEPRTNVRKFHSQFPLPLRLFRKWKNGVSLWCTEKSIRHPKFRRDTPDEIAVVQSLLRANIVEKSENGPFVTHLFNVPKDENGVRPIVNLSQLSKRLTGAFPVRLCSVFQLVDKPMWEKDLWYVKLDFAQAFYNIPIAKASRSLLTFKVGNSFYRFRRMPFGLGCAPYVCQTFLLAMMKYIREYTPFVWGNIDDLLIAHQSNEVLVNLVRKLWDKCARAGWRFSLKKCVLT